MVWRLLLLLLLLLHPSPPLCFQSCSRLLLVEAVPVMLLVVVVVVRRRRLMLGIFARPRVRSQLLLTCRLFPPRSPSLALPIAATPSHLPSAG